METEKKGFEGKEMIRDHFLFFENFKTTADKLPDDLRLKFYDALTDYAFNGVEPDDAIIAALVNALKPSLDKKEKRGGNHNPAGQNQHSNDKQKKYEVKTGQNNNELGQKEVKVGQSAQSFLETRNKKQENNIPPSEDKSSSVGIFSTDAPKKIKTLVPYDWQPEEVVAEKLRNRGLLVSAVVEKFINSCHAKGLKYVDFNRAILAWDWSSDKSLQRPKPEDNPFHCEIPRCWND